MTAPRNEILLQRIDRLTEGLAPAVSRGGAASAEFALMLSMVQQAQTRVQELRAAGEVPDEVVSAPARDQLYSPEFVVRLGAAMQQGRKGELALLVSWLDTVPLKERFARQTRGAGDAVAEVPLSQAAVLARSYTLLDEIQSSKVAVAA